MGVITDDIERIARSRARAGPDAGQYGVEDAYTCHLCRRGPGRCFRVMATDLDSEVWACWQCLTQWTEADR